MKAIPEIRASLPVTLRAAAAGDSVARALLTNYSGELGEPHKPERAGATELINELVDGAVALEVEELIL